mmetsp:Transcript_70222/g.162390  ORF Transcript_70222/g.162390 Transcript_70222/m.162390 type:complete len:162 (+) Transcript_70222:95-580(+)
MPLLFERDEVPRGVVNEGAMASEQARAVSEARSLLEAQLGTLQGFQQGSLSETSELLRETCQMLSDLATRLQQAWQKAHPGEPQPYWPVETIPEEELARIGWDFHANRVQLRNTGGFWEAVALLLSGDQSASFAKPPSAAEVAEALARTASRLRVGVVACH